jgi:hypothetical protein
LSVLAGQASFADFTASEAGVPQEYINCCDMHSQKCEEHVDKCEIKSLKVADISSLVPLSSRYMLENHTIDLGTSLIIASRCVLASAVPLINLKLVVCEQLSAMAPRATVISLPDYLE